MKGGEMQQTAGIIEMEPTGGMLIEYPVTDTAIEILGKKFAPLRITDSKSYKLVASAIGEVRGYRVSVEKKRKELKKDALEYGRRVDGEAKRITALLMPIEEELKAKKKVVDDQKEKERAEKARIETERVNEITERIASIHQLAIGLNSQDSTSLKNTLMQVEDEELLLSEYAEFEKEARLAIFQTRKIIKEVISTRERLAEEKALQKAEAERLEKIRLEQVKESRKLAEAKAEIEAENRKIEQARQRLEAEKQAEVNRKEREALEKKLAAEAKIQAQKDAEKMAERKEAERVARERLNEEKALQKVESERLEKARIEQEAEARRLKAENAKIEAAKKAEDARLVKAQAKIDSENQRIEDEKQAEKDAKEKARREEAERVAKEEAEAAEEVRREMLKPDKDRLIDFANKLLSITHVHAESEEAIELADEAIKQVYNTANWLINETRRL